VERRTTLRFDLTPRSVGWILLAGGAVWLASKLWPIAILCLVALVLVGTLNPLVTWLAGHGVNRHLGLVAVFLALVLGTALLLLVSVPPLVSELTKIIENAPANRQALIQWLGDRKLTQPLAHSVRDMRIEEMMAAATAYVVGYSSQVVTGIGYAVTTLFLAFYLLADGERAKASLFALVPREYHVRLARILLNLETIVGGYMRGQLITSAAIGLFVFGLLTALGVPNALSLAVFAALTDVIPFIGGILATVPAVLASLSQGSGAALLVLVVMIVYQELESRVLVPRVYGRVLRLSPAAVIIALLIGGMLLGIIGALLALPVAAGLQMIARELRVEMPGDDTDDSELRARDERAEKAYERLSAGAPPAEAAAIAEAMAREIRADDAADPADAARVPITGGEEDDPKDG